METEAPIPIPDILPVLPIRDTVIFPYIILPLSVSQEKNMLAVDQALAEDRLIFLLSQRDPEVEDPGADDLYEIGTTAAIMRMLKLPDGRVRILVQGLTRARMTHLGQKDPFLRARIETVADDLGSTGEVEATGRIRSVKERLEQAASLGRSISPDVLMLAAGLQDAGRLADLAASNLELGVTEAQQLLQELDPIERLQKISNLLNREIQVLTVQQEISSEAREEMDRSQREYFLRQQLKTIQQELGETDELSEEVATYRRLAEEKGLPEAALEELERQIRRLQRSHPDSAETTTIRTYLEWVTGLPWQTYSEDSLELEEAKRILDEDHYDLEKVKERILEYLAVRRLKKDSKGPLICFVGPPGVGKTSLGRSIARAMGRKFVRISLGGVRDEAEIRGHRRTYVGALPGRILQGIHQAGTSNPIFMLDEIDKIGSDYRGDPSSALLEVLDPEQNSTFRDHYIGLDYDLSKVVFIATANLLEPIQPAFLDRMEVLRLSGYTAEEKIEIARRHLIPKQQEENGLQPGQMELSEAGLKRLISHYTKEAGLRNLEREIAAVCRKVAVRIASGDERPMTVTPRTIEKLLGPARHYPEELLDSDRVGIATGLAWTAAGGDLLFIEVIAVPGKGELTLTGQLGAVMKESAQAALSYARSAAQGLGVGQDFFAKHDLHVHVPAGSIPKDGPSAGITIATAVISLLSGRPVDRRLAMTGEITLRGEVLPIGGLKEKVLAARSAGIRSVVLPKLNQRDLQEIPRHLKRGVEFHLAEDMNQVIALALRDRPAEPPIESLATAPETATLSS
ncbi:MAG: endopeptidase La [Deltaproteobacteria bacterium]|nr:endopeptidase La [Deltaproteobacteria bacterium]